MPSQLNPLSEAGLRDIRRVMRDVRERLSAKLIRIELDKVRLVTEENDLRSMLSACDFFERLSSAITTSGRINEIRNIMDEMLANLPELIDG